MSARDELVAAAIRPGWDRPYTEAERRLLDHTIRWGLAGYPVRKVKSRWIWDEFCGVRGAPTTYRTKREAVAAVDALLDLVRDRLAREAYERAVAERGGAS